MALVDRPNIQATAQRIRQEGIVAIVRGNFRIDEILEIGDALLAAPLTVMEVTLNTPSALDSIGQLRRRYGENMLIGAGTVRTSAQARQALDAGAQFLVAPNLDLESARLALLRDTLLLPGIFTATEAQTALNAGCAMVKLFPNLGPDYLKALRAPLDDIEFVPTGGVGLQNIGEYARAGAAAVGVGSSLVPSRPIPMAELITRARALRTAWMAAEGS